MSAIIGIVVNNEPGGFARIMTNRASACGGCSGGSGECHGCSIGSKRITMVANPIGAKSGDTVRVELNSKEILKGAAVMYLFPVIAMLTGGLVGSILGQSLKVSQTISAITGSTIALFFALLFIKAVDRSQWVKRELSPRIVAVLTPTNRSAGTNSRTTLSCCP